MLTTIRDAEGKILASAEWWLVDQFGQRTGEAHGLWVWVEQLEISRGHEGRRVISQLIHQIAMLAPFAIGAYWMRRDTTRNQIHFYSRTRLTNQVREVGDNATV